jgi:hypothetical protein
MQQEFGSLWNQLRQHEQQQMNSDTGSAHAKLTMNGFEGHSTVLLLLQSATMSCTATDLLHLSSSHSRSCPGYTCAHTAILYLCRTQGYTTISHKVL